MEITIVMNTAEVIITSISGPAGIILYFLTRFYLSKKHGH